MQCQQFMTDELLWTLFKSFDIDDTGYISISNLREVFHRLGRFEITEEEIKDAFKAHGVQHAHKIGFKQFKNMLFDDGSIKPNGLFPELEAYDALAATSTFSAKRKKTLSFAKGSDNMRRRFSGSKHAAQIEKIVEEHIEDESFGNGIKIEEHKNGNETSESSHSLMSV